jgi:hypothetical protein
MLDLPSNLDYLPTVNGRSVVGLTSKIHMVVDSNGNPIDYEVTGGQVHDIQMAMELIERPPKE